MAEAEEEGKGVPTPVQPVEPGDIEASQPSSKQSRQLANQAARIAGRLAGRQAARQPASQAAIHSNVTCVHMSLIHACVLHA